MEFDRAHYEDPPFSRRVEKPWGYELIFTQSDLPYTGKLLHIRAGKRLSLQYHDRKQETQYLLAGRALLVVEDARGELREIEMETGRGYTNHPGQRHRLAAIEDADIFEVSTPEIGNTYRLDDDYHRDTETEAQRALPNRGWSSGEPPPGGVL
jgi:oxalate decarboxylase/phosphoglucose isomerase-like protein (cupin superfamily)